MEHEAALRAIQGRQLGLITRDQALGVASRRVIEHRLEVGTWRRVLPSVYADSLVAPSLPQSTLASLLWAGREAVACFLPAGALLNLDGVLATEPEVWTPRSLKSDLVVVHHGTIPLNDRRRLGPITITSPARTIVDLAGVLDDEDLTAVVEDAIHRGLTTPMSIRRCLDAIGGKGRPGTARLRAILDDRGDHRPTMSRLEVKIWRTLRAKGLTPFRQYGVRCGGRTTLAARQRGSRSRRDSVLRAQVGPNRAASLRRAEKSVITARHSPLRGRGAPPSTEYRSAALQPRRVKRRAQPDLVGPARSSSTRTRTRCSRCMALR